MSQAARELAIPATRPVATDGGVYGKTILALALVLRLGVVSTVLFLYPRNWMLSKSPDLVFLAQSLVSGRGLSSPFGGSTGPTAFLAPGYPAILALAFRLFGGYSFVSGAVMMGLQTLFAVLTVAFIMDICSRIFGAPAANLAGAFWAVSPPLIWLPAVLWETSLSILLLTGMVALALRGADKQGGGLWMIMGAYCGLAMLVNPSLMLSLFAIVGWTIYQARPVGIYEPCMWLLVFLAIFAPWPIRNARVLHAFIPLRSNFGYEVWQGNHSGATGLFDRTIEPLGNKQEYSDYAAKGEVRYMRAKGTLARDYIRTHPGKFLRLSAERVVRFWTGAGFAVNSGVVELHAGLTSLLGLAGLAALYKRRRVEDRRRAVLFLLPLLVFPLPYYITHAEFRYRLVLDPLLTILGAYAITRVGSYRHITRGA
jgi:4-amino-4-deoxy-L-arabinose transferase-like glycosyltransferase